MQRVIFLKNYALAIDEYQHVAKIEGFLLATLKYKIQERIKISMKTRATIACEIVQQWADIGMTGIDWVDLSIANS